MSVVMRVYDTFDNGHVCGGVYFLAINLLCQWSSCQWLRNGQTKNGLITVIIRVMLVVMSENDCHVCCHGFLAIR